VQAAWFGCEEAGVRTQGLWTLGPVIVGEAYLAAAWPDHLEDVVGTLSTSHTVLAASRAADLFMNSLSAVHTA
jgi:hypothetical protein